MSAVVLRYKEIFWIVIIVTGIVVDFQIIMFIRPYESLRWAISVLRFSFLGICIRFVFLEDMYTFVFLEDII